MPSKYRFFFRAFLASYAVVGYGIPIACALYHDTFTDKYNNTRQAFKTSPRVCVFPFYFSRKKLENELRNKLESRDGKLIFIYGKPYIGKSTLMRHVCSTIENGILRITALSFEPFHKTLSKRLHFDFTDYSWTNLWKHIYFPLALCATPKRSDEQQLKLSLNRLSSFCKLEKTNTGRPWILTIDDADHLTKKEFIELHSSVRGLIDENLLTLVIISSDPVFAAFVTSSKFNNITRLQMDEMNLYESCRFLESRSGQLFVNRMRHFYGRKQQLTKQEMQNAYNIVGGIPLWLVQCCVKPPHQWFEERIETVKAVIDQQEESRHFYKVQTYMVTNKKTSLGFKEFIEIAGSVDNAVTLLHGIPKGQKRSSLFFHDLNKNKVALQYKYLQHLPLQENIVEIQE